MPIKLLDQKVVSQIAAGEVVERPASVVKELVENSLDASATQISVEIKGGGVTLIRVTDNGSGIADDDVELAFHRHATSKIESIEDLQSIRSLGFRGEALPSIAAVADIEMSTCASDSSGVYICLDNGKVVKREPRGCAKGTSITVRNLFRKVPARLKFLKTEATESGKIADVLSRYALVYPAVKFCLMVDGKSTLQTAGSGNLIDAAIEIYGIDVAQHLLEVDNSQGWDSKGDKKIIVTGIVGSPKLSRSGRDHLTFAVNKRWVSSRLLSWAVEEAYHGLLMEGKHPVAIIDISLPPEEVDVNIHPAKTEVKFRDEHAVFGAVQKSVRQALMRSAPVPKIEETSLKFSVQSAPAKLWSSIDDLFNEKGQTPQAASTPQQVIPVLRVLGQALGTYIVAEGPGGIYVIDQHAAHERILFEKVKNQRDSRQVDVQGLLEPVAIEIEPRQDAVLKSHYTDLSDFGFDLESFGERTYLVRSVPTVLIDGDWRSALNESLDSPLTGDWSERMFMSIACHGAVRAGKSMAYEEMVELLEQLRGTETPHTCPHGRPIMLQLSMIQLEKEFGRR